MGVDCRPMCRDMPLCAAICRSLERKLLIFLGFVFSSQAEGRRFEPGLALKVSAAPPVTSAGGVVVGGVGVGGPAIWP